MKITTIVPIDVTWQPHDWFFGITILGLQWESSRPKRWYREWYFFKLESTAYGTIIHVLGFTPINTGAWGRKNRIKQYTKTK